MSSKKREGNLPLLYLGEEMEPLETVEMQIFITETINILFEQTGGIVMAIVVIGVIVGFIQAIRRFSDD